MKCYKCGNKATHYVLVVVETPERETDYNDQYTCDLHTDLEIASGFAILETEISELPS